MRSSSVAAVLLSTIAVAQAANVCVDRGCPGPQTADAVTYYQEPCYSGQTANPPKPGAVPSYGANGAVTWKASEPTTIIIPTPVAAGLGVPGTTYSIATSTASFDCLVFEKPYLTSTIVPAASCPTPQPVTITETSYQQLPPQTSYVTETTTSTSVSVLVQPTTEYITSTATVTEVSTTTSTVTNCPTDGAGAGSGSGTGTGSGAGGGQTPPPPVPCENREFQAWKSFTLTKSADGSVPPFSTTIDVPNAAVITVADGDFKSETYTVTVDGQVLGSTSDVPTDTKKYCKSGDDCLIKGFSNGQFKISAGSHQVQITGARIDPGYSYWRGYFKVEEDCTASPSTPGDSGSGQGGSTGGQQGQGAGQGQGQGQDPSQGQDQGQGQGQSQGQGQGQGQNQGQGQGQDSGQGQNQGQGQGQGQGSDSGAGAGSGQNPPTPPVTCQNREFQPWKPFTLTQASDGSIPPFTTAVNLAGPAILNVVDGDFKSEKYTITVDGQILGSTSDIPTDPKKYCKNANDCLQNGYSNGQFKLGPGSHSISISGASFDRGYSYWRGYFKLDEDCSAYSSGGSSQQQPIAQPKPACQNRVFKPWTTYSLSKSASGTLTPLTLDVDVPAEAYLSIVDGDFKSEQYSVSIDGVYAGLTSGVAKDNKKYCKKADDCLAKEFSTGRFNVPAGKHSVAITAVDFDPGYSYFTGYYKLDEKCD